jgi:hypothetical protein
LQRYCVWPKVIWGRLKDMNSLEHQIAFSRFIPWSVAYDRLTQSYAGQKDKWQWCWTMGGVNDAADANDEADAGDATDATDATDAPACTGFLRGWAHQ